MVDNSELYKAFPQFAPPSMGMVTQSSSGGDMPDLKATIGKPKVTFPTWDTGERIKAMSKRMAEQTELQLRRMVDLGIPLAAIEMKIIHEMDGFAVQIRRKEIDRPASDLVLWAHRALSNPQRDAFLNHVAVNRDISPWLLKVSAYMEEEQCSKLYNFLGQFNPPKVRIYKSIYHTCQDAPVEVIELKRYQALPKPTHCPACDEDYDMDAVWGTNMYMLIEEVQKEVMEWSIKNGEIK